MNATLSRTAALDERVAELEARNDHAETFRHVDGSVTVVAYDFEPYDFDSPRDYDGNVATLISESRDYLDLDSDDAGLSEARDRFDNYDRRNGLRYAGNGEWIRGGTDRAGMMARYVAMFRPDIAYYCDRWEVSAQGSYNYGWGYVTTEAMTDAFPSGVPADYSAEQAFDAEVAVYQLHFAGEYYYSTHLTPRHVAVSTTVDYAAEPVTAYDDEPTEESCYGFLGYDHLSDIATQMGGELA